MLLSQKPFHLQHLKKELEHFGKLSEACWTDIRGNLKEKTLEKGQFFSRKGQYNREFAFVSSGIGRIYITTKNGDEFTKYFFQQNDFLIASIEPQMPSQVNVQALTEICYTYVPFSTFDSLISRYNELSQILNRLLLGYFGKKQQREINLLSNSATENYKLFLQEYPELETKIPHYHIASHLGITPVQLSRIRKNLAH
ncbi:Crp/Fnr family transcriptional regulator [Tunicatimonas pelagia]|uniref:Crp/Fnr family transcriptional regulator n=1 Tax=Tunicatimonas pelagia TaxID=931531 RepID=UPI0026666FCF|nr:Crp/Fnr family transcriptional regulator [Tunicatimonas pelagia]WKN44989.1 Crp/Fnr family transcriptional regulator [Tunicatimonas pelagia]